MTRRSLAILYGLNASGALVKCREGAKNWTTPTFELAIGEMMDEAVDFSDTYE